MFFTNTLSKVSDEWKIPEFSHSSFHTKSIRAPTLKKVDANKNSVKERIYHRESRKGEYMPETW